MLFSHRAINEPAPKKISRAPPDQAVSEPAPMWKGGRFRLAAASEVSPKMSGALKSMTPRVALIQSCQRIARGIAFNLPIVLE